MEKTCSQKNNVKTGLKRKNNKRDTNLKLIPCPPPPKKNKPLLIKKKDTYWIIGEVNRGSSKQQNPEANCTVRES